MNWRQQLSDASPLSRLVALQQALIRINSHSIISPSQNICVFQSSHFTLWTQYGKSLPSWIKKKKEFLLRLNAPAFSLSVSLTSNVSHMHASKHTDARIKPGWIWILTDQKYCLSCNKRGKSSSFQSCELQLQLHTLRGRQVVRTHSSPCCWPHDSALSLGHLMRADTACLTSLHYHHPVIPTLID